jgi:hypothetical protein
MNSQSNDSMGRAVVARGLALFASRQWTAEPVGSGLPAKPIECAVYEEPGEMGLELGEVAFDVVSDFDASQLIVRCDDMPDEPACIVKFEPARAFAGSRLVLCPGRILRLYLAEMEQQK